MNLKTLLCVTLLAIAMTFVMACGDDDTDGSASPSETLAGTARPTPLLDLPVDFPEDFPLYPDISLDQGARFENQVLAAFTAPDDFGTVASFYRTELAKDPWSLLSETDNSQGTVITITFRHASDEIRGTVTLSEPPAGGGTAVNTTFIVPVFADPLPSPDPTEPAETATPTPEGEEGG